MSATWRTMQVSINEDGETCFAVSVEDREEVDRWLALYVKQRPPFPMMLSEALGIEGDVRSVEGGTLRTGIAGSELSEQWGPV